MVTNNYKVGDYIIRINNNRIAVIVAINFSFNRIYYTYLDFIEEEWGTTPILLPKYFTIIKDSKQIESIKLLYE